MLLRGFGPASSGEFPGRWLIAEVRRDRFSPAAELTLVKPVRPKREPAPEMTRRAQ